jgi:hypothetical protein
MDRTINWGSVFWSALLIFSIPVVVTLLTSVSYGVYIGFQVRGDQDAINAALEPFLASPIYQALPFVLTALVAFWRGRVMSRQSEGMPIFAVVIAALMAQALALLLTLTLFQSSLTSTVIVNLLITTSVAIVAGIAGSYRARQSATA